MRLVAVVMYGIESTRNIINILTRMNINYKIVLPTETPPYSPTHIILSGASPRREDSLRQYLPSWVINSDCPTLGISYGMNLIVEYFGGFIVRNENVNKNVVEITEIVSGEQLNYLRWIDDDICVIDLPEEFDITGVTDLNYIASFTDNVKWWGVKYHPEIKFYRDADVFRRFLEHT